MKKVSMQYSVTELCGVFNVSMSSYYYKSVVPNLTDINFSPLLKVFQVSLAIAMENDEYGRSSMHGVMR